MLDETGECTFDGADDANIPVNIFISTPEDNEDTEDAGKWSIKADNFMPGKAGIGQSTYQATADSREELIELVTKYVLPLYTTALQQLNNVIQGKANSFYYWELNI